jgi:Protein of unknown function (DUF4031)
MVSDESYAELHDFAAQLGIPPRAFQGDHYDVPTEYRTTALIIGATAVTSRELVIRLRAAGLRLSPAQRRSSPPSPPGPPAPAPSPQDALPGPAPT